MLVWLYNRELSYHGFVKSVCVTEDSVTYHGGVSRLCSKGANSLLKIQLLYLMDVSLSNILINSQHSLYCKKAGICFQIVQLSRVRPCKRSLIYVLLNIILN